MSVKEKRKQRKELDATLKLFKKNLSTEENQWPYYKSKQDLEKIYDNIAEGIRIRSRYQWYEEGEKSSKCFLNLEKINGMQSQIRKIIVNNQEVRNEMRNFYESLFKKADSKCPSQINDFFFIRFSFQN